MPEKLKEFLQNLDAVEADRLWLWLDENPDAFEEMINTFRLWLDGNPNAIEEMINTLHTVMLTEE